MTIEKRIVRFLRFKTNQEILLSYLIPILIIAIAIFVSILSNFSNVNAYLMTGISGLIGTSFGTFFAVRAKGVQHASSISAYVWNLVWAVLSVLLMLMT